MSAADPDRVRVHVANPADGGVPYWLGKLAGFAVIGLTALSLATLLAIYGWYARHTPDAPDLSRYASVVPGVSRIYAGDDTLLGEFADEWRQVVPYDRIPKQLVNAFVAAEDHDFFSHGGLYFKGIARAAWRNATAGDWAQGGSTITQQVAKQFLGSEKTLTRKVKEAIIARRLEARYSKEEILSVYLNHIFLGSGAYGVQAAAKRYFSKDVWELDVGEMATIAGLAQSPSRDSPLVSRERARRRRDQVLDKMAKNGFLSAADAETWKAAPITLAPYRDVFLTREPYFAEHVRRYLVKKYGPAGLMKRGLRVETTVEPWVDGVAYENVDFSARKQDKRQGWRGPEARLDAAARKTFLERTAKKYGDGALDEGRHYLALVEKVDPEGARVRVGAKLFRLPLRNMSWAAHWSKDDATNDQTIDAATSALKPGDVVWVARPPHKVRPFSDWQYADERYNAYWVDPHETKVPDDEVLLEQPPRVQGALYTFDHTTGYVLAMVGGQDYTRSEFDRTTQACRQPGSTYKPIYYSLALDQGYGFDTVLNDIPRAEVDPITGEVWVPVNLHGEVDYSVSLEYALVFSKNVPSVDIFTKVGAKEVEAWARRLGFTSTIIADKALALGASCTYMDELSRAFAIFARSGRWIDEVYVRRVIDRDGRVLEDHTVYFDPMLPANARLDRLQATAGARAKEAIPAHAAWLVSKLLREVVTNGYSGALRAIDVPAAGKTGTSSATMDVWFVAFTSRWLTSAWMGDDLRERPLGKDDAAFMSVCPMWARYMKEATTGQKLTEIPWATPDGIKKDDRGGSKGRSADPSATDPEPLAPHKPKKLDEIPPGADVGKLPKRKEGQDLPL